MNGYKYDIPKDRTTVTEVLIQYKLVLKLINNPSLFTKLSLIFSLNGAYFQAIWFDSDFNADDKCFFFRFLETKSFRKKRTKYFRGKNGERA